MQIESSAWTFDVARAAFSSRSRSESLRVWVDPPAQSAAVAPRANSASSDSPVEDAAHAAENDPYLRMLIALIEHLTGKPVRLLVLRPGDGAAPLEAGIADAPAPRPAGWGLDYRQTERAAESELTSVAVRGVVKTADGRQIGFTLDLEMSRSWFEERTISVQAGDARRRDPLVLSFDGSAAALTGAHFRFDLDADGRPEDLPGLAAGQGFLVLDANRNGLVDDGRELLGQRSGEAFRELARLDADGNGWIDEADPAYARLAVWRPGEDSKAIARPLGELGVGALLASGAASPFSLRAADNGELGAVRATGVFLAEDGSARPMQQIDLVA